MEKIKEEMLTFTIHNAESSRGGVKANIGSRYMSEIDIDLSLGEKQLLCANLSPCRGEFEDKLMAKIERYSSMWEELEQMKRDETVLNLKIIYSKNKTITLCSEDYPMLTFYLQSSYCKFKDIRLYRVNERIDVYIESVDSNTHIVNVTDRAPKDILTIDELKSLRGKQLSVLVKSVCDIGVFVIYKNFDGLVHKHFLHHYNSGDFDRDYYLSMKGKEMLVYLLSVEFDKERNKYNVSFAENTIEKSNKIALDSIASSSDGQPQAITPSSKGGVVGTPISFIRKNDIGISVLINGVKSFVNRRYISDEIWQKLPFIYELGNPYRFKYLNHTSAHSVNLAIDDYVIKKYNETVSDPSLKLAMPMAVSDIMQTDSSQAPMLRQLVEGSKVLITPLNLVEKLGIKAESNGCTGVLPFHQMQPAMSNFTESIVKQKIGFEVYVRLNRERYSFDSISLLRDAYVESKVEEMEVACINSSNQILLRRENIFARLWLKDNGWINDNRLVADFPIGTKVEVRLQMSDKTEYLQAVPTTINPEWFYNINVGDIVDVQIDKINKYLVVVKWDVFYGILPIALLPQDYELMITGELRGCRLLYYNQQMQTFALSANPQRLLCDDDIAEGDSDVVFKCITILTPGLILAQLGDKYTFIDILNMPDSDISSAILESGAINIRARLCAQSGVWFGEEFIYSRDECVTEGISPTETVDCDVTIGAKDPFYGYVLGTTLECAITQELEDSILAYYNDMQCCIPRGEMSWCRHKSGEIYSSVTTQGRVTGKIIGIDRDNNRLILSPRSLVASPYVSYSVGDEIEVTIASVDGSRYIAEWGEYMAYLPFADTATINDESMGYAVGERVTVNISSLDTESEDIYLSAQNSDRVVGDNDHGRVVEVQVLNISHQGVLVGLQGESRRMLVSPNMMTSTCEEYDNLTLKQGDNISAEITAIFDWGIYLRNSTLPKEHRSDYKEGDVIEVTCYNQSKRGLIVYTESGEWGFVPQKELSNKSYCTDKIGRGESLQVSFSHYNPQLGAMQMSRRTQLPSPVDYYKIDDEVSGYVYKSSTSGYYVELEYAIGFIFYNNATWCRDGETEGRKALKVGNTYKFHLYSRPNQSSGVNLTRLSLILPFDSDNRAQGVVTSVDDRFVTIDSCGVDMFIPIQDDSLSRFRTGMLGLDMPIGTQVEVEYVSHTYSPIRRICVRVC